MSLHGSMFQTAEESSSPKYNTREEMLIEMILNFDEFQITNLDVKQVVKYLLRKAAPEHLVCTTGSF